LRWVGLRTYPDGVADERRQVSEEPPGADGGPQWRVEGARHPPKRQEKRSGWDRLRPQAGRRFWLLVGVLLILNWWLVRQIDEPEPRMEVPYTVFRAQVDAGNVASVVTRGESIEGTFKKALHYPPDSSESPQDEFVTVRPPLADEQLLPTLLEQGVTVESKPPPGRGVLEAILITFGPVLLFVFLFFFLLRRLGSGAGGISGLGRSKARRYEATTQRTTFADVAGIEEAEEQLVEIVDFLRAPEKYRRMGAAIPRGVLLSGPPGTGKTLLARAMAGEAGVPFFSLSASEFVEMVVGVGASRVRDLFNQAKEEAPAIIFIDELDAVGRARGGSNQFAGHDEREQTLNQILTEMDGFSGAEGVIVIGSTNRPEILDPALLRPGRFDRQVVVNPPDQRGRRAILAVHTRGVPVADDVDLDTLASTTPGMVGADLRNLVNEAALLAARRDHERVTNADISDALEKVILGAARKLMLSEADKERTAYHEAGHALLGMLQPGSDPVRKVSIVPRGRALGITLQTPEADRYGFSADFLRQRIATALGGRAAEELVYGEYTTGAESDLEYVTRMARAMVGRWGMSQAIGPLSVLPPPGAEGFAAAGDLLADETRQLFDAEVRRVVDDAYERATTLLREHRGQLDALVAALLEQETLDESDAYRIAGITRIRAADNGAGPFSEIALPETDTV
jgi:cell division protease FtsH